MGLQKAFRSRPAEIAQVLEEGPLRVHLRGGVQRDELVLAADAVSRCSAANGIFRDVGDRLPARR